ncbi:hypothetical protein ACROYT_G018677 [Oculina patagonica]
MARVGVECNTPAREEENVRQDEVIGKMTYKCKYCGVLFNNFSACIQHEQTHNGMKPYTCKHCSKCFSKSSNRKKHEQTHARVKPYSCKHCNKCFRKSSSCKTHERTHTRVKPQTCKMPCMAVECNTPNREEGNSCGQEVTGEMAHECKYCGQFFCNFLAYVLHERTHAGMKRYTCKHCSKCFKSPSALNKHERTHSGVKPYECKHCKKRYKHLSSCKQHEQRHAVDSSSNSKQNDKHVSKSKRHLNEQTTRVKPHSWKTPRMVVEWNTPDSGQEVTGEMAYQCKYCGRVFSNFSACVQHEETHNKMKPYACKHCSKCFKSPSALNKHERTHSGVKPYECKHCSKCFKSPSALNNHERTHSGVKPYECKHCKKRYKHLLSCKQHEQRHAVDSSLNSKQNEKPVSKSKRHLNEQTIRVKPHSWKTPRMVVECNTPDSGQEVTGEMAYQCKYCGRFFSNFSACIQHEETHNKMKPYACKHCSKCFSKSSNRNKHERTHSGVKPYECKHCKKRYKHLLYCKQHEQRHAEDSSLNCRRNDKHVSNSERHLNEQTTTQIETSCMFVSTTEENLGQVESLTCWICQEEFSSKACIIQHYDDHMRKAVLT